MGDQTEPRGADNGGIAPPGMVIRYDAPVPDIADAITGYHVYARHGKVPPQVDWFLPGTANVRIVIDAGPIAIRIGRRNFDLTPASLFGPTTRALRAVTQHGTMVGFGISAIGWARMGLAPANTVLDRIVPLADIIGHGLDERLLADLAHGDLGADVKPQLDTILRPLVARPHPDEALMHRINELVVDNDHVNVARAAVDLGVSEHSLRRVTTRYFGMTPKLLLSRARFLRVFLDVIAGEQEDYGRILPAYHDIPHFLRDARRFLGMTPRQFHLLKTPFLDASLRMRPGILGSATQALHRIR
jgi:AraC-like DNA-binding protein